MNDVDDRTLLCVDAIHAIMHIFGKCSKYQYSSKYQCSYLNSTYMFAVFSGIRMFSSARKVFTQKLLHREVFTYTQELYTPTCFYTEERLHTDVFLDRRMFTYRHVYTGTSLHTDGLTHRSVYTQAFTQKPQKLLQTDAFTQTSFYTQMRLHRHGFTQM